MTSLSPQNGERIGDKKPLIEYIEQGCKPRENWRIGTEHEKFAYHLDTLEPLEYEGDVGVRALLDGLTQFGWEPVLENGNPIAMKKDDKSSISLEPAGQIELSGAPVETVHQTCSEVHEHLKQVKQLAAGMGIGFLGLGYHPKLTASDMPWMPKGRYKIMRDHMPRRGTLGLEMMQATCTVQVNLDFNSEENMVKMFRVAVALQPIATALWANSPFKQGSPSGFLSYRSNIWTDTDPDRCGMLPFVFEDGFGFERYVDYILDVPMYFVYRDGKYIDVAGHSFKDFMAGKLEALPGERPTIKDFEDHLSTAFPEVRLKQFIEMRGADGGSWDRLCALPAFWVGLLYDQNSLDAAWDLVKDWTVEEMETLRTDVPKLALAATLRNRTAQEIAEAVLELSHQGLSQRNNLDKVGMNETHFLKPLFRIAESGLTPAEELLAAYEGRWHGNVEEVFREYAY
ncbi:MAG: glutamate--cysteine ligase [Rhodospirillaceae bacterium]|jgi:glutamate--cysteine ligase|nr:glutamate--cysteine ligase [Rhodospirillales bacterium]MBT3905343.1 glutamate--cysteine ligase [Rhodospirillaceae bacterium]MBT4702399.1 glutamate--cysteine ligase [Rhodospirillaceae bacterium]MBT5035629.1 glutamate--cysteine ligase [Rhodospirillaceae bacterium]MBT6219387.1 glutamate--cysteine ligase [Rhodospirillaceae bacterium]